MIEEPPVLTLIERGDGPDDRQIAAFQGVPTSFVADAMEGRGALSSAIQPLRGQDASIAGPALTADNSPGDILATLAALDMARPGDVLVATVAGHQGCAAAGDLVAGMLSNAGVAGFVTDGPMRDLAGIRAVGLPCWCTGLSPASPFTMGPGTVGGRLNIGGQSVATGDIVVADSDGVVVVPLARIGAVVEALEAVGAAEEALEAEVRDGLRIPGAIAEIIASDRTRRIPRD